MRLITIWSIGLLLLGLILTVMPPERLLLVKGAARQVFAAEGGEAIAITHQARSFLDVIRAIRTLAGENQELQAKNTALEAQLVTLKEVEQENSRLREELAFINTKRDEFEILSTRVIGRAPSTFLQFILINRGTNDGVAVNQAVIAQGFLVGRVIEVTPTSAQVQLVTASRSKIPILLQTSRSTGLLKGGLSGLVGEDFASQAPIEPGEIVITSGLGGITPAGLPVGTIAERLSAEGDFIGRASIHSPIEFGKLELLIIVKPK